jgi:hypothetical protein
MLNMIKRSAMGSAALAVLAWATLAAYAQTQTKAQSGTAAGRFTVEHPTLENLGFEWAITGDANRNAAVSVEFRRPGEVAWRKGLPLVRVGGERIFRDVENLSYIVPDGFAGSIFNLEPGTEYEARFTLTDPDGASGQTTQTVRAKTRVEPQPFAGGRTLHVYPPGYKGERKQPAFTSLLQAYYGAGLGDWSVVWERRAQPGDTILMHAGIYRNERLNYVDPMVTPFDGTMWLTLKGTAEKPITIKAAGDGDVVIDGAGNHRLFDVQASTHHIFDGITFRDTDVAMFAGMKEVGGAVGLTVKNCRFENIGFGVWTEYAGSSDFYIADNVFLGRPQQRDLLVGWNRQFREPDPMSGAYGSHEMRSYYAVKVYGPGHVIAHNAIAFFHDGIGISTYGTPPNDPDRRASSIDIYGNDIHLSGDDFVEGDGGVHNIRVYKNRGVNAPHSGYSAQPVFGGPIYFIRNISFNARNAFKINANPAGLFMWHNTLIGEQTGGAASNMHYRNNLFIGRNAAQGVMRWVNVTNAFSSDYNGYRPNPGATGQYQWQAPSGSANYATLAALSAATGQERHGVELDTDAFENMTLPDPAKPHQVYHAMDLTFRLKPGGKAVDAGDRIPTVNDGFAGVAPDLGALEVGQPEPHYGPRWLNFQPFYR